VSTEYLLEYPSVQRYLSRLGPVTQRNALYCLKYFFTWVRENSSKLGGMTPDELVEYQRTADNSKRYEILDLVQSYILSVKARYGTKNTRYSIIRGFFKANRAELPSDDFKIKGDRPRVVGRLKPEELRQLLLSCKQVYRAVFMCMFAGGMGQDELIYWSNTGAAKLEEDLKSDPEYVRVDLRGRKSMKNIRPYYTILMGDALVELKKWMAERPRSAKAIFIQQFGGPLSKAGLYSYWLRHMQALGYIKRGTDNSYRTGRNPHEMRDLFRSQWEKSPAVGSVAEFAMGHVIDELEYNKAHLDERWVVREFRKAVPMLNILSGARPYGQVSEDEVERLRRELEDAKRGQSDALQKLQAEVSIIRRKPGKAGGVSTVFLLLPCAVS